jgi:metal-responsive CopG/Arc/MetJ family transcriptional regulator
MAIAKKIDPSAKRDAAPRTSVSFPPELYHLLEQIALKKRVSLAWVIRDAAESYVAEQWPLLSKIT